MPTVTASSWARAPAWWCSRSWSTRSAAGPASTGVVGYGATGDAYHLTGQPDAHEGLQRAMRGALQRRAASRPTDVQYINAHGTSTPLNDPNESQGIKAVFGEHAHVLSVSSTKSATGHMLGAAGAVEFIACALAIRDSMIPPTINYHTPDPECDLDYTPNVPRRTAGGRGDLQQFGVWWTQRFDRAPTVARIGPSGRSSW